jgi:hypothetical protein
LITKSSFLEVEYKGVLASVVRHREAQVVLRLRMHEALSSLPFIFMA